VQQQAQPVAEAGADQRLGRLRKSLQQAVAPGQSLILLQQCLVEAAQQAQVVT
jgi:hypothetical protein